MEHQKNRGLYILIVDDEMSVRRAITQMVQAHGFNVRSAATVTEAKTILDAGGIEIVISDVYMPGNEKLAFLSFLQGQFPNLPVIVMTGEPTLETAVGAMRHEAIDYVTKPIEPDVLLEALEAAGRRIGQRASFAKAHAVLGEILGNQTTTTTALAGHLSRLSIREQEVTRTFMEGKRPKDISNQLHISESTVRNHFKSIYRKLDVNSQLELQTLLRETSI